MKQPPYRTSSRWKHCECVQCPVGFCLCVLILLNYEDSVSSQELPVVMKVPDSTYLEENKTASFQCVVAPPAGLQPKEFPLSWSRVGGLPVSASINNSRIEETEGVVSYQSTFTFSPGALDNQIVIKCTARIESASGSASYTPKVILVPLDPIIVAPNRSDASGKLTWTCHSLGASQVPPNVYWRDGRGLALRSGITMTTSVEQKPNENIVYSIALTITLEAKDFLAAASLVCVVVHGLAQYSSRRSTTQVLELPRVSKNGSDVLYVTEGAMLTVSCVLDIGHPPATNITWSKDGQPVTLPAPGRYSNVSTKSADLVIGSVSRHDMGDYLCSATSLLGGARFTSPTTVIVRYRPRMAQLTNASTVEATAGGSAILQCPVNAFPTPTSIQWSRVMDGQKQVLNTSSSPRYSGASATDQQYDLGISLLLVSDAGVYICEAFNEVGRGTGPAITLVVTSSSTLVLRASADKVTAVVFGVISLFLLVVIIVTIIAACYICKCSKGNERARVGPLTNAAVKPSGRMFLPALTPEAGHAPNSDEDAAMLTTPVTFLPPASLGDDHADSGHNGPAPDGPPPETLETPVFRLPPLDPDTRSYDTPFRWSAHLQNNPQTSNGNVFKVSGASVSSSLDQTSVLREKLAMMK